MYIVQPRNFEQVTTQKDAIKYLTIIMVAKRRSRRENYT